MHAPQLTLRSERVTRPHMLIEQGALLAQSQALRNDGYDRSPELHYLLKSMDHVQLLRHRWRISSPVSTDRHEWRVCYLVGRLRYYTCEILLIAVMIALTLVSHAVRQRWRSWRLQR